MSLRDKIAAIMAGVILLFGLWITIFIWMSLTRILTEEHQDLGLIVSRNISRQGVIFLQQGDFPGLEKLVKEEKNLYGKYFDYVLVVDSQEKVLAHTFWGELPGELVKANKISPGQTSNVQLVRTGKKMAYDIAVPISAGEGMLGLVRVGVSKEHIGRTVTDIVAAVMRVTAAVIAIGTLFSFLLASIITRPLSRLTEAAKAIGHGHLNNQVDIKTNDEIGKLGKVFNQMTADLRKSESQLKEYSLTLEQRVEERTQELKQTQVQLVQSGKLAAIGQLGAGVAHELNNPIGGILGYAEYLLEKVRGPDFNAEDFKTCEKPLGYIKKEAERCQTIIENLLKFSRRSPEGFKPLNINHVIEDTLTLVGHQLMVKKVELKKKLADDLKLVEGNANQLQQVFTNIIFNAQQAMPEGGILTITTRLKVEDKRLSGKPDFIEISFTDTGCGIPPENLDKIFDPFFTTKMDWKGTGLGLSVSYQIVQNHKGQIKVESLLGNGTTFTVFLPV